MLASLVRSPSMADRRRHKNSRRCQSTRIIPRIPAQLHCKGFCSELGLHGRYSGGEVGVAFFLSSRQWLRESYFEALQAPSNILTGGRTVWLHGIHLWSRQQVILQRQRVPRPCSSLQYSMLNLRHSTSLPLSRTKPH